MSYDVFYTEQFENQLQELNDSVYERVEHSIDVLAANPGLSHSYDPEYEAARPPVPCHCYFVPRTTKTLYLIVKDDERTIVLLYMGDTRQDPRHRFDDMD